MRAAGCFSNLQKERAMRKLSANTLLSEQTGPNVDALVFRGSQVSCTNRKEWRVKIGNSANLFIWNAPCPRPSYAQMLFVWVLWGTLTYEVDVYTLHISCEWVWRSLIASMGGGTPCLGKTSNQSDRWSMQKQVTLPPICSIGTLSEYLAKMFSMNH